MRRLERIVAKTWGQKGKDWFAALPSTIKQLSKHWSLTQIILADNLSYHYVARALQKNKTPVILKIGCDEKLISSEYQALKYFNGHSTIKALDINKEHNALLLEQAIPGHPLKTHPPGGMEATIKIYAETVKSIATQPAPKNSFPHMRTWCEAIDRINNPHIKSNLVEKAKELRNTLLNSAKQEYLCHGDLHLENILQQGENWLCIDPKGVIGETAFEAATFNLLSKKEREAAFDIRTILINRITLLSNALEIDMERLLSWCFLRNMISAQWLIEDNRRPKKALFLATHLHSLLKTPLQEMKNVCITYEKISDWYDTHRSRDLFEQIHLNKAIALIPPQTAILDLGCGTGEPLAKYFLEKGFDVTGVDCSTEQINKAKERIPSATLIVDDMRRLKLKKKFACIIAWHSFFHLTQEDQRCMFEQFEKYIQPNGILLFTSGPEAGEVWSDSGGEMLYHASLDPTEYKSLLNAHHFEVLYYKENDSECLGANVWMARYSAK